MGDLSSVPLSVEDLILLVASLTQVQDNTSLSGRVVVLQDVEAVLLAVQQAALLGVLLAALLACALLGQFENVAEDAAVALTLSLSSELATS